MNSESFVISGKLPVIYCLAWIHFDISLTEMLIMIASRGAVLHVSDSTHIGLVLLKEMHTILNFVTNNFRKNIAQIAWVQPDIERYEFCSWNWQLSPVFTNNNAFHYFAIWSVTVFVALTYNTSIVPGTLQCRHMSVMVSQITDTSTVCSTDYYMYSSL